MSANHIRMRHFTSEDYDPHRSWANERPVRPVHYAPSSDSHERFLAHGRNYNFNLHEDIPPLQIININENDDQNRKIPQASHHDLIDRDSSPASDVSGEWVWHSNRRHSFSEHWPSSHYTHHHTPSPHHQHNDQHQLADQFQSVTIRSGEPGYASGRATHYDYMPVDPYGRIRDHWEIEEQHIRDHMRREQRYAEDMKGKAVSDYREERRHVQDEIDAALTKHDLEQVEREKDKKAAVELALKKKQEEDIKKKEAEAVWKAKYQADQAKKKEDERLKKELTEAKMRLECYRRRYPLDLFNLPSLQQSGIPWRYDQGDNKFIIFDRDLTEHDLDVLVKFRQGLFHTDFEVDVHDDFDERGRKRVISDHRHRRGSSLDDRNGYGFYKSGGRSYMKRKRGWGAPWYYSLS